MVDGEERIGLLAATNTGRIIDSVFTVRDDRIRVVTAYPARPRLRREYERGR